MAPINKIRVPYKKIFPYYISLIKTKIYPKFVILTRTHFNV